MRRDGRFEPLALLAQGAALASVLVSGVVAWVRHERPAPVPPHRFREVTTIESPRRAA